MTRWTDTSARVARGNPEWPRVGVLSHRHIRRINWLGASWCRLLRVNCRDLHVAELDAVDGTPVQHIRERRHGSACRPSLIEWAWAR
ncbi:TrmO family methyltransferase domain-containing protein [Nocardia beijingensis]